ncbi:hypothetical protein RMATCC62417_16370 [Rhizopus microsporus]|nr:hypothetical protein RMATCC62417_16370 [Rhizopus microsporus]
MLVKVLNSVDWNQVYLVWRNYYEQRGHAIAFQTFFHPNNFFAPDSDTVGIPLKLGKTVTDEYMVVMSLQISPSLDELTIHKCEVIEAFTTITDTVLSKYKTKAKKLNKQHERMRKAKEEAALGKRLVEEGKYVFMAIDLEAYERDHSIILEIGWSIFDTRTRRFMDQHYLIDSYQHLINETFVDDQKLKFDYGTSVWCSLKQAFEELKKDLTWAVERDGGFVLVGHGLTSDLKYLRQQKFMWPTVDGGETKDVNNSACVAILNTDTIYGASINDLHNPSSLGKTLDNFGVETWNLHNAGNDAHYTMLLLLILLGYENK